MSTPAPALPPQAGSLLTVPRVKPWADALPVQQASVGSASRFQLLEWGQGHNPGYHSLTPGQWQPLVALRQARKEEAGDSCFHLISVQPNFWVLKHSSILLVTCWERCKAVGHPHTGGLLLPPLGLKHTGPLPGEAQVHLPDRASRPTSEGGMALLHTRALHWC